MKGHNVASNAKSHEIRTTKGISSKRPAQSSATGCWSVNDSVEVPTQPNEKQADERQSEREIPGNRFKGRRSVPDTKLEYIRDRSWISRWPEERCECGKHR